MSTDPSEMGSDLSFSKVTKPPCPPQAGFF
jgi:hypothetical protein